MWGIPDPTVKHTVSYGPGTWTLTATWKTTVNAKVQGISYDELIMYPPGGGSPITITAGGTNDGFDHSKSFTTTCEPHENWGFQVRSGRPRFASGTPVSYSTSKQKNFTIPACLD
jgi:hypothetical protein